MAIKEKIPEGVQKLRVVEAMQDDAYKGIARVDTEVMKTIGIKRGDIILIKGQKETVAVADRAYPADVGEGTIRIDGILRRNAKTGVGESVTVKKADVKEAKKIMIAPAQQGIMVQADPETLKSGLLGRAVVKGDILVMGGVQRRKDIMSEGVDMDEIFGDIEKMFGGAFGNMGGMGFGGIQQIKFIVAKTSPDGAVIITENTQLELSSKAVEVSEDKILEVTYEDVGGLTEEVRKIREMVELPLKHPEIFDRLGVEPPKGVLLHGPPGTGKTLLAKAVANEAEANFILLNGPEIMSKFYGESEKKVRDIFQEAEKNAPSIIFIDEIDAIAPKREDVQGEVERRVVSQLLTMMDGLQARGKVVVIGATNRPNSIDPALRRPGRFDREVEISVPDKQGRLSILKIHTRNMPMEHWNSVSAGKIMLKKIDNFDEETQGRIGGINSKLHELNKKANLNKEELKEKLKELKDLENYHNSTEESTISRILNKIKFTKSEIDNIKDKIETYEVEQLGLKNKIEKFKKDITQIFKRKEQIEQDKKLLNKIIQEVEELRHQLIIRSSDDIRKIFYERKLGIKDKELNDILDDFIDTGLVSDDYFSEVNKESLIVLLDKLASVTHGFVGADLNALAKEAAMAVIRKIIPKLELKEEQAIPEEVLKQLIISDKDFEEALKIVRPSAMREVLVETPNIKWEDVGGLEKVKQELKEAVEWPLKFPDSFKRMGIRPPRGLLLYGPPGTGKTLLAKAVAKESEANFIQVKGPSLLSMWVGESEKGVRKIFERARQVAPCIIFFDEIDSLAGKRGMETGSKVTEHVLNQLLAEMDGIEENSDIVIIGATNRPDILDAAILRPGRFDRILLVGPTDKKGRLEILKIHTKNMPLAKDIDINELAEKTEGYVGSDLEGLCREAAMLALRKDINVEKVKSEDFEEAMRKVKPSVTKNDIERYKKVEENYLKSAKAALESNTAYLG